MIRTEEGRFSYEMLEEVALAVQERLKDFTVPHCAFNGGKDVWVDVGNKSLGIRALQVCVCMCVRACVRVFVCARACVWAYMLVYCLRGISVPFNGANACV